MPFQNAGAIVQYHVTGGNPGGYISTVDVTADWANLQAPAKFLAPGSYDGTLSFDLKAFSSNPVTYPVRYGVRVGRVGNGLTLINVGGNPAGRLGQL